MKLAFNNFCICGKQCICGKNVYILSRVKIRRVRGKFINMAYWKHGC
jgi:hypothetical protein